MSRETLARRITRPSLQVKLFVNKTRSTSFHPLRKSRIFKATTLKSTKLWLKLCRTPVSYFSDQLLTSVAGFYVDHGDTSPDEESIDRLWLVVRSLKNPDGKFDYKINKFDTIKLGRVRFRVKDFKCE